MEGGTFCAGTPICTTPVLDSSLSACELQDPILMPQDEGCPNNWQRPPQLMVYVLHQDKVAGIHTDG